MYTYCRYNPACAGTTGEVQHLIHDAAIQPRVCGDYAVGSPRYTVKRDTTPRVRGLLFSRILHDVYTRYNPACAGTTSGFSGSVLSCSIQPRVCGDYALILSCVSLSYDTTPRVRGLRDRRQSAIWISRYNPACAGTTFASLTVRTEISIQPRVCGDYDVIHGRILQAHDTTPRVRGLPMVCRVTRRLNRYNPACAGTTLLDIVTMYMSSIQPRVCGDYPKKRVGSVPELDTTPRVRGLHLRPSSTKPS